MRHIASESEFGFLRQVSLDLGGDGSRRARIPQPWQWDRFADFARPLLCCEEGRPREAHASMANTRLPPTLRMYACRRAIVDLQVLVYVGVGQFIVFTWSPWKLRGAAGRRVNHARFRRLLGQKKRAHRSGLVRTVSHATAAPGRSTRPTGRAWKGGEKARVAAGRPRKQPNSEHKGGNRPAGNGRRGSGQAPRTGSGSVRSERIGQDEPGSWVFPLLTSFRPSRAPTGRTAGVTTFCISRPCSATRRWWHRHRPTSSASPKRGTLPFRKLAHVHKQCTAESLMAPRAIAPTRANVTCSTCREQSRPAWGIGPRSLRRCATS